MKVKVPKPEIIIALAQRLLDLGIDAVKDVPDFEITKVATGKRLMVVTFGPDPCPCCNKPKVRAVFCQPTRKPLEELWPSTQ